jgi:hypothetical protein
LKALGANAKKETIRMDVAKHLQALYQPPAAERKIAVPKNKSHVNPYFDVLAWANQNVEWAGPEATSDKIKISHALLPVLYHHFSCVCPSFEALEIMRIVAKGRPIADIGSGNGYWTYMLRRMKDGKKSLEVVPVDNGLSEWRTLWVPDTVEMDSADWLKKNDNGKGHVMTLVYPQVGHDFTERTIKAYRKYAILKHSGARTDVEIQMVPRLSSPALRTPMVTQLSRKSYSLTGLRGRCRVGRRYVRCRSPVSLEKMRRCLSTRRRPDGALWLPWI